MIESPVDRLEVHDAMSDWLTNVVVVKAVSLNRNGIQMILSLIIDLGFALEFAVDRKLESVTAREIGGGTDSVGRGHRPLTKFAP